MISYCLAEKSLLLFDMIFAILLFRQLWIYIKILKIEMSDKRIWIYLLCFASVLISCLHYAFFDQEAKGKTAYALKVLSNVILFLMCYYFVN